MKKKFIFAILFGLSTSVYSQPVYLCEIKDNGQVATSGILEKTGYPKVVKDVIKQIIFDETSGKLSGIGHWKLDVVQQGNPAGNSLKARREHKGSMNYVIQVLTIQVWLEKMPFTYFDDGIMYSGTCRKFS